jgi:hypothetical protein
MTKKHERCSLYNNHSMAARLFKYGDLRRSYMFPMDAREGSYNVDRSEGL